MAQMHNDFHMGNAVELCVREHGLTREEQDAFAVSSYEKALAQEKGCSMLRSFQLKFRSEGGCSDCLRR